MCWKDLADTKTNIHEVAPFLLTFVLHITLAQDNITTVLPIISIAHFIIYFVVGHGTRPRRGVAIFHTGVFIITCDALALVLFQYDAFGTLPRPYNTLVAVACLAPGLARMCLPMCAPFMKRLFLNIEEGDSPFIIAFMQLSGFLILLEARRFVDMPTSVSAIVGLICAISALYAALLAISDESVLIPYYFLVLYASLAALVLFIAPTTFFVTLSLTVLLLCLFLFTAVSKFVADTNPSRQTWFLFLGLLVGAPGFGIGVILWPVIYFVVDLHRNSKSPFLSAWAFTGIIFSLAVVLFCYAVMIKARKSPGALEGTVTRVPLGHAQNRYGSLLSPTIVALLSLLIAMLTMQTSL